MVLYIVNFYMLHKQKEFYQSIIDQQKELIPGQWVQKQKCWPLDGKNHTNEQWDFIAERINIDVETKVTLKDQLDHETRIDVNCVEYWERIK